MLVALCAGPALGARGDSRGTPSAKMARIGATLLVSLGAVHAAQIVDGGDIARAPANLRTLTSVHGYELRGAFTKIVPRLARENDSERAYASVVAPFWALKVPSREFLSAEIGAPVAHSAPGFNRVGLAGALLHFADGAEAATGPAIERGLGASVLHGFQGNIRGALSDAGLGANYAEALGRYGTGFLSLPAGVAKEVAAARGTLGGTAFLRGLGRRIFRCSVVQLYWGPGTRLDPAALSARLIADQAAMGVSDTEMEALRSGLRAAARDYGFPADVADKL